DPEALKRAERWADTVQGLRDQIALQRALTEAHGESDSAIQALTMRQSILNQLRDAGIEIGTGELYVINALIGEWRAETDARAAAREAAEARNTRLEEGRRLTNSLRTPQEIYIMGLARARELLDAGAISLSTYGREVARLKAEIEAANDNIGAFALTLEEVQIRGLRTLEDGLVDLATGARSAKQVFGDMARSILADIVRMQVQAAVLAPLARGMGLGDIYAGGGATKGGGL